MFVIVVYSAPATLEIRRQQRQIFIFSFGGGVDKYLGLLALAGTWWQYPERSRKKFMKLSNQNICNLQGFKNFWGQCQMPLGGGGGGNHFWG